MNQTFVNVVSRPILATVMALAVPLCGHGQQPTEAARVHFLLAIDTQDRSSKALGLDLDRDNMKKVITDSMQALGYKEGPQGRYTMTVLDGGGMSEKTVLDHYRRLKVGDFHLAQVEPANRGVSGEVAKRQLVGLCVGRGGGGCGGGASLRRGLRSRGAGGFLLTAKEVVVAR